MASGGLPPALRAAAAAGRLRGAAEAEARGRLSGDADEIERCE